MNRSTLNEHKAAEFRDRIIEQAVEALFREYLKTGRRVNVPAVIFIQGEPYDVQYHLGLRPRE